MTDTNLSNTKPKAPPAARGGGAMLRLQSCMTEAITANALPGADILTASQSDLKNTGVSFQVKSTLNTGPDGKKIGADEMRAMNEKAAQVIAAGGTPGDPQIINKTMTARIEKHGGAQNLVILNSDDGTIGKPDDVIAAVGVDATNVQASGSLSFVQVGEAATPAQQQSVAGGAVNVLNSVRQCMLRRGPS